MPRLKLSHYLLELDIITGTTCINRDGRYEIMSGISDRHYADMVLLSMKQLSDTATASAVDPELLSAYLSVARWIRSYLMRPHSDLGRPGDVCPFTTQAFRLDTIRIGVSRVRSSDIASIKHCMRYCFREFALMPCPPSMRHFRTIIVGFPGLDDADGLESLKSVQNRLKVYCLLRGLMIARFHAASDDRGLWNPQFRPLRSPIPLLVIRQLVKEDAPFAIRHPLLIPTYLWKYSLAAPKRLLASLRKAH